MSQKIVIFDLDGTLVDSGSNIAKAINHTRVSFGLEPLSDEFILNLINRDDVNAAEAFYGTKSFTKEQKDIFEPFYHEICTENIEVYEKIDFFLEEFKTLGFRMAVATNAKTSFAKRMLSSVSLECFFDAIVGADMVSTPKPSPLMLTKILDDFGARGAKSVMLGDSIKDVKAAKGANSTSVVVEWGFGEIKPKGDKNIKSPEELAWIIDFFKE